MVNLGPLPTSMMQFFVILVNSIRRKPILGVRGVPGYIIVIIRFGYSADVLVWQQATFNLRIISIVAYTKIKDKLRLITYYPTNVS